MHTNESDASLNHRKHLEKEIRITGISQLNRTDLYINNQGLTHKQSQSSSMKASIVYMGLTGMAFVTLSTLLQTDWITLLPGDSGGPRVRLQRCSTKAQTQPESGRINVGNKRWDHINRRVRPISPGLTSEVAQSRSNGDSPGLSTILIPALD